ncbi:hypothetical protein GN244_ATG20867 [Phytophthora infestans]|uniref:RNase H type-1 domain-containing protein n=1 Tax=Phytophthora infestans TaxID=4787 RepID=A0A833RM77_PHYIN|nr:hypothetical protein GN244_ATG20867 [Phytophthora infestans]
MRRNVQSQLGCLSRYTLTHIDRVANRVAEGLVSAALNSKNTTATCSLHPRSETPDCWTPGSAVMSLSAETEPLEAPVQLHEPVLTREEQAAIARRGGGEVYPAFDLNVGAIPVRRLILRLRQLDDPEKEQAEAAAEAIASSLAVNISNTVDWDVGESYITAMSHRIYEVLLPFSDKSTCRTCWRGSGGHAERGARTTATRSSRNTRRGQFTRRSP